MAGCSRCMRRVPKDPPYAGDGRERSSADHEIASRGGAAGQRRLRADGQHVRRIPHECGDFSLALRERHTRGESTRDVRRVAQKRGNDCGVAIDDRGIAIDVRSRFMTRRPGTDSIRHGCVERSVPLSKSTVEPWRLLWRRGSRVPLLHR